MSVFGVFLVRISPYSVRMQKNTDQKNSECGHFLRSASLLIILFKKCISSGINSTNDTSLILSAMFTNRELQNKSQSGRFTYIQAYSGIFRHTCTAQKMKFSIKDFFSKCDQTAGNCGFGHIY